MDLTVLCLVVAGLVLVIASMVALTTAGQTRPLAVMIGISVSFVAYISIILVRVGVLDLSWLIPGSG